MRAVPSHDQLADKVSKWEISVETMQRLRELPVRVVHGGHEPSFGRPRLIKIADAYLDRHDA